MVFYWSLGDSKSPLVSWTRTIFWPISAIRWYLPPISNWSSSQFKLLGTVPSAPITTGITVSLIFHCLALFIFLWCPLCDTLERLNPKDDKFSFFPLFFFLNYYKEWYSDRNLVIRLYLKIPENFMHLILYYKFWFEHISFGCMVKFPCLEQYPVDQLSYQVVSSLVIPLCKLGTIVSYRINVFSFYHHFLVYCVLSIFPFIQLLLLCCYLKRFGFRLKHGYERKNSLSFPFLIISAFFIWEFTSFSLEISLHLFFFTFQFSS